MPALSFSVQHIILRAARGGAVAAISAGCLLLLAGCGGGEAPDFGGERADGVVEHPIADSIPHVDRDHIAIDTSRSIDEMDEVPEALATLADYLQDPEGTAARELNVIVNGAEDFHVAAVDERRLVMLDTREQRLLEYDLATDDATVLAEQGEGPGDVHFTQDLAHDGTTLYVAMQDRRLDRFDCQSSPCAFHERTSLDFSALSVAPIDDTTVVVLGQILPSGGEPDAGDDERPVRLVGTDGSVLGAFGTAYRSQHYILRHRFLLGGTIRHLEDPGRYVLAFPRLPYLYVYDEDGALQTTYALDAFLQGFVAFGDFSGRQNVVRHTVQDMSQISGVEPIGGSILVKTETRALIGEPKPAGQSVFDFRNDYYAVDLAEAKSYHIGSEAYTGAFGRSIFVTDAGLVINRAGTLSFVAH